MTECIDEAGEIRRHKENKEKMGLAKNKLKSLRRVDRVLKEVLFLHDGNTIYRGTISDPPYLNSEIIVDGVKFTGFDAAEVINS